MGDARPTTPSRSPHHPAITVVGPITPQGGTLRLVTVDTVSANDTANGGLGADICTTDPGDTRISCP